MSDIIEESGFSFDEFSVEIEEFEVRKTGKFDRMWKVGPGGSVTQIPCIVNGVVYFGSLNHNVYALKLYNGELLWKFRVENKVFESSPVYWKGRLYFGSFDRNFYCIDAETGELMWKYRTNGENDTMGFIEDGMVYFGSRDHCVYALDAMTGTFLWKFETRDEIVSSPAVYGNRVFIGSFDHNLYCLDAGTGNLIWKFQTQGEVHNMNPLLVHEGVVYFPSFDNYVRAVDAEKGNLIWKFPTGKYGHDAAPSMYRGVIYQPSRDGTFFALTPEGKLLWKFVTKDHLSVPAFCEDRIFFGSEDMKLYCLSVNGEKLWDYKTEGLVFIRPSVEEGKVVFTSWDCSMYCVEIETQMLLWKFRCEGSPAYVPPPNEGFEFELKIPERKVTEEKKKAYDLDLSGEEDGNVSAYKSRITYQVSTQYASKGKYQVNSDEEAF